MISLSKRFFFPGWLWIIIGITACDTNNDQIIEIDGDTMGTSYHVKVIQQNRSISEKTLEEGIDHTLSVIDQKMSTYREDSELSAINQAEVGQWINVSADTLAVLTLAQNISQETHGSFDVTIAPLVNLWGFGPTKVLQEDIPAQSKIRQALSHVGYQHLRIKPGYPQVMKDTQVMLDFSAIAKGFAVDRVARYLESSGFVNYLVEVGGEIRTGGTKPDGRLWKIAIESPLPLVRRAEKIITLSDVALATSGDYRNFFEQDGKHYSHTIDPVTGKPVTHTLASVTVIDPSCARADALATALMVMGPTKGMQFVETRDIAAFFIVKQGDSFKEDYSFKFGEYLN